MEGFVISLLILIISFYLISWSLRRIISWLFRRKYNICLKIGRIGIPYMKLCDIRISKNGFSIHIEQISIRSSFFNSELTKLITLVVRDVRINKDISQNDFINGNNTSNVNQDCIDFRDKKIPSFISKFAQFMAVHIHNISAILLRSETPECLTHAMINELRFDGSILKSAKLLLVTLNLIDASIKVLKHAEQQTKETCLIEFKFGISMDLVLIAQGPLSVEKLDFRMSQTSAIINDNFYNIAQSKQIKTCSNKDLNSSDDNSDVVQRIMPLIPKSCLLLIEETSLKGVKETGQIEYNSSLKKFLLNYRPIVTETNNQTKQFVLNFCLLELQLQNSREKLIKLNTLNIDAKLNNQIIDIYFQLNNFTMIYNHDVIHNWIYKNFLKYQKALRLKDVDTINNRTIYRGANNNKTIFNQLIENLMINICAEFTNVSVLIKLNRHNSSIGFNHVKLMLEQAHETRGLLYDSYLLNLLLQDRHWQMEFLIESFWWSFKEWHQDTNISKNMHVWGTPIYFVKFLVKLWSTDESTIKIMSLLDTIQLEWSLELADWVILAVKYIKKLSSNTG